MKQIFIFFIFFWTYLGLSQSTKLLIRDINGNPIIGAKIICSSGIEKITGPSGVGIINIQLNDTLNIYANSFERKQIIINANFLTKSEQKIVLDFATKEFEEVSIIQKKMAEFDIGFLPLIQQARLNTGTNSIIELEHLSGSKSKGNPREVFAKIPGINIWESDGAGIQLGVGGRGLSPNRTANFNTRQNGYDISADALGYPESYYTPPIEALKSIEIIRGAAALQYGTQFGGLLNFVIRDPINYSPFEFTTRQTIGNYGYLGSFNRISGTTNKLSYQSYYQFKKGDGYRENSQFSQHQYFTQVNYTLSKKMKIGVEYTKMKYLSAQAGGLTDVLFETNPQQSIRNRNWFLVDWNLLNLTTTYELKNGFIEFKSFGMLSERNTLGFLGKVTQMDPGGSREMIASKFRNAGGEIRYLQKFQCSSLLNLRGAFVFGGRYYQGVTQTNQGKSTDGYDPIFEFQNPANLENSSYEYPSKNKALFFENVLFLTNKLRMNSGIRLESIESGAFGYYKRYSIHPFTFDTLNIATYEDTNTVERLIPLAGVGLSFKINSSNQLYSNLTQNYRAINFSDIRVSNPNIIIDTAILDEKGFTIETGFRGVLRNFLLYDVAFFYIFYGNKIGLAPIQGSILKERTNIGNAQNYGLESFFEMNWSKAFLDSSKHNFSNFINLSFIEANYKTSIEPNFINNQVEYVSKMVLRTGVKYQFKNLLLQTQFNYNSRQFSDASNSIIPSGDAVIGIIPSYYVLDFSGRMNWDNGLSIELGINNLTNSQYFTRRATGYPGPGILPSDGITAYFTLQYQFSL